MATPRDWAEGYLAQARADLSAATLLSGQAPSVLAMLLQMVFEKLGKAALLRSGQITLNKARSSHVAASRMVLVIKRGRAIRRLLGQGDEYAWHDVLPVVQELERAHPQLSGDGPHLEYPWEDKSTGEVRWPEKHLQIARRLADPKSQTGARIIRFATQLSTKFDEVFPR